MTAIEAVGLVGGWLFVAFALATLMSLGFCTRHAPRWARNWRDAAGALVGLYWALLASDVGALGPHAAPLVVVGAHLAIAQSAVAAYGVLNALRRGDRCWREMPPDTAP